MTKLEYKFSIKKLIRPDQDEYCEAIKIYNETTPANIKTRPNEISHWLLSKDKSVDFEILIFALYLNNKVIGFSMMTYLKNVQTIVIEYISLSNQYRVNTVFFSFINLMQNYTIEENYNVDYYVVEICNKENGSSIDKESRFFKKLICLEDFAKIDALYYTLPLGLNCESSFEALLYIKSNDKIKSIQKDTYLSIINSIYNDYTIKWYEPFLSSVDFLAFKQKEKILTDLIKKNITSKSKIDILYSDCPLFDSTNYDKTSGHIPSRLRSKKSVYPIIGTIIFVVPIILIYIYNYLLKLINIPLSSVSSLVGTIFSVLFTSFITLIIAKKKL